MPIWLRSQFSHAAAPEDGRTPVRMQLRHLALFAFRLFTFSILLARVPMTYAHGDLHDQIEALTREIKLSPTNAALYLKRGELHRFHDEWKEAGADYDQAFKLDPALIVIDLLRGRLWLDAKDPEQAKTAIERFLQHQPDHPEARLVRARALVKLGKPLEAAEDYSIAMARIPTPRPDYYLERANALAGSGDQYIDKAVAGLEEGIKKLGPIVTLELAAVDLEVKQRRYDAALQRIDLLASKSPRQETWLARRGEILEKAGRSEEARKAFESALRAMESLNDRIRGTQAMIDLEKSLREKVREKPLNH